MKFLKKFYKGIELICSLCLIIMVFSVTVAVVGRYIFHSTPPWTEELALLGMTWIGLLSASLAEYKGTHIRISTIDFMKRYSWFSAVQEAVYAVAKILFSLALIYYGTKLTQSSWVSVMGGIRISVGWKNITAPLAGGCILIMIVGKLLIKWRGGKQDE